MVIMTPNTTVHLTNTNNIPHPPPPTCMYGGYVMQHTKHISNKQSKHIHSIQL